ncbi:MAG: DUF1553 domain-containing protein, partial [Planctomycetota bacterium]
IRAGNPPTNPQLLDHLTNEFIESGFDTRHVLRLITTSRTYSLSHETNKFNEDDQLNYSHALPRRLPAEVIYDAVHRVTGALSKLPGMPPGTRAVAATDAGVKLPDGFLDNLGRPARESACECERLTDLQLGPVMALISGPTIGDAISDAENDLTSLVGKQEKDHDLVEEIFLRSLSRYPTEVELKVFDEMRGSMEQDHENMLERLVAAEAEWSESFPSLEQKRLEKLEELKAQLADREKKIAPEREKLAQERQSKIDSATKAIETAKQGLPKKANDFIAKHQDSNEWFPLAATQAKSTANVKLIPQDDRSLRAEGVADKATYTLDFSTRLTAISGVRIEAMSDETLSQKGPGAVGNFVVTEVELTRVKGKTRKPVKIAKGYADFLQSGFKIELAYDGQKGNQNAWAAAGAVGVGHWASFALAEPLTLEPNERLEMRLYQNHNAKKHLLGRFRVSVSTDTDQIRLGLNETLASISRTVEEARSDGQKATLNQYVEVVDSEFQKLRTKLNEVRKAVPPDTEVVRLGKAIKRFSAETPIDPALVRLRADVEASKSQIQNARRTGAEDLIWALVNSPAFLFNH